jgi:hypothetical protein
VGDNQRNLIVFRIVGFSHFFKESLGKIHFGSIRMSYSYLNINIIHKTQFAPNMVHQIWCPEYSTF